MLMDFDRSLIRQRNEELVREVRKLRLQRSLRASREQPRGGRPPVWGRSTGTGELDAEKGARITFQPREERPVRSMKNLLGRWRKSLGGTVR